MRDARDPIYRERKAHQQHRRCFYCGFPMWSRRPEGFARHFGISISEAALFHCTAEHLLPRCDGGTSRFDNIVAACWFCNSRRHLRAIAPNPERYRELVRRRVANFAWHHQRLHKMLGKRHMVPGPSPFR
jgi:5-methylcytosine-specific restriction endonuclease McrA